MSDCLPLEPVAPTRQGASIFGLMFGIFGLIALSAIAYQPVTECRYIWDDNDYVTENVHLRTLTGLIPIWFQIGATPQYYPLVHTSFWCEYRLWGLNPLGYHLVNVALHALNAIVVFLLWRRFKWSGAWLMAAIFLVHPVQVESVAWITERKNVLSGLFYLLTIWAWLEFDRVRYEGDAKIAQRWYITAIILFIAALLSKTIVATLPGALLVLVWFQRGRINWRDLVSVIPFFALGIGFGILTAWMERTVVAAQGPEFAWTFWKRLLVAGRVPWFYLQSLLWPDPLIFFYPKWTTSVKSPEAWAFPLATAGLLCVLVFVARRSSLKSLPNDAMRTGGTVGRAPLAAILFFGGTLVPVMGFLNVYPMRYSYVADHFQYLASLGPIALFVAGICWPIQQSKSNRLAIAGGMVLVAGVLLSLLTIRTREHIADFRGHRELWEATIRKNPRSETAFHNLGVIEFKEGDQEAALKMFQECVRLDSCPEGRNGIALILRKRGQLREAFSYASEAANQIAKAEFQLLAADLAFELGKFPDAVRYYRRASQISLLDVDSSVQYAESLLQTGEVPEAYFLLSKIVANHAEHAKACYDLGLVASMMEKTTESIACFRRVIKLAPKEPGGYLRLGEELETAGQIDAARLVYQQGRQQTGDAQRFDPRINALQGRNSK